MTPFPPGTPGQSDPLTVLFEVTPDNDHDLPFVPRALILSVPAAVRMTMVGGGDPITVPLPAGYNPIRPQRIFATGTGSVTIVAGY